MPRQNITSVYMAVYSAGKELARMHVQSFTGSMADDNAQKFADTCQVSGDYENMFNAFVKFYSHRVTAKFIVVVKPDHIY